MPKLLAAFALLLCLASPAAGQGPFSGPGEPIVFGRGYDFPSKAMGESRRINVLLPPGYDEEKQKATRYPVLYLLDGGADWQDFLHIAAMVHQGSLWGINQPMIVVGIASKDRRAEFTDPSSDPGEQKDFPTHGKSETFRRFLVGELRGAIDSAYRTDGTDALIGESLAGYFVVDTALRHGGDFDRYIAISPSLWWNREALSKRAQALLAARGQAPRTIWLSMADEGREMQGAMDRVVAALRAQPGDAVKWTYTPYPLEKHNTIYHPAATAAIRALFPPPPEAAATP
jgi:uncharacterized protein